jgi:hypothetical protein
MNLGDFVQLMRQGFSIASESIDGRPYYVRLIGPPYNSFVEGCRSIGVMAHNRGTKVSPHHIKQVLAKFEHEETEFRDAYNSFFGLNPPQARAKLTEPIAAKPNAPKPN